MISKISIGLFSLLSFSLMFAGFYVGDGLSGFGLILFMTSLLFAAEFLLTPTARFMVVVNNLSLRDQAQLQFVAPSVRLITGPSV
jgi:hypothetical protein